MIEVPDFLLKTPKVEAVGISRSDIRVSTRMWTNGMLFHIAKVAGAEILQDEDKRRNSHREPRRKFTLSQLFLPSSSLQLTGKPFDNMSNTGE
jgi:hypothetical protein